MPAVEIDDHLQRLDEPKRSMLSRLRRDILAVVPGAEECLSYGVPGFKIDGTTIAGFEARMGVGARDRRERIGDPSCAVAQPAARLVPLSGCLSPPVKVTGD